jgi:hypothetical protein
MHRRPFQSRTAIAAPAALPRPLLRILFLLLLPLALSLAPDGLGMRTSVSPALAFAPPAKPLKSCSPASLPPGASTTCTLTIQSDLTSGATVADTLAGPATISALTCLTGSGGLACGAVAGTTVNATCTAATCLSGSTLSFSLTSSGTGPLGESVTITPAGGAPQAYPYAGQAVFFVPSQPGKSCTPAFSGETVCTITLTSAVGGGTTLLDTVATGTIANCGAATGGLICVPTSPTTALVTCTAAAGLQCAAGSSFTLSLSVPSLAPPLAEKLAVTPAGGSPVVFSFAGQAGVTAGGALLKDCSPVTPVAGVSTTTCTIITQSGFSGAGGTITDSVTAPSVASFIACAAVSVGFTCGPTGGSSITVTCSPGPPCGSAPGASFTLTIASPTSGPLVQSIAQSNVNGGAAGTYAGQATFLSPQSAPTKSCNPATPAAGTTTTCTISLTSILSASGTITDTAVTPAGATLINCINPTGGLACGIPTGGANNSVTLTCTVTIACPAGASFQVTLTSPVVGAAQELLTLSPPAVPPGVFTPIAATFSSPLPPTKSCVPPSLPAGTSTVCTITLATAVP